MADIGQGYKYQLSVTAYLASALSKNKTVKDYYIFYEVKEVELFDDIVLAVQYNESEDLRLYFIQVKSGKVTFEIKKYLDGYAGITKKKKWEFLKRIDKINEDNFQFWYFACKNITKSQDISFQENSEIKRLELKEREDDNRESIIDKKYNKNYKLSLKGNSITTTHQDFFDHFYIYLQQPNAERIVCILGGMWKLNNPSQIIDYLDKYLTKNKNACLSKTVFEHELLRIRLSNYIVTPIKVPIPMKKEPADAWINLTLSHSVTIIENTSHTKACLFGCILAKIGDILTIDEWNKFTGNEGKLSEEVKTKFSSEVLKPQTIKDLVIQLWKSNKIPLILKAEDDLPALKEFFHLNLHYIVIDSKTKKRYDEMKSYNLSVIKDMEGLQVDELLQSISVSMQGRKPASLYEIINGDKTLLETLSCSDILKLIEPKQVYLMNECLKNGSNMLFIIETENIEHLARKTYKTIEENVLMYSPPNQSEVYYQQAIQDSQFKNYKIYRLYSQNSEGSGEKLSLTKGYQSTDMDVDGIGRGYMGLEYFFVDQHGDNVYIGNDNRPVPVIGEMVNLSCPRYLSRRLRKGTIKHGENRSLIDNDHNPVIEYTELSFWDNDFFNKTTRKICVVTGEPGIGKTIILRYLLQICHPQNYVLFCDLALYQTDLYDKSRKKSELCNDPLNFLCNVHNSLLYKKFLSTLKNDPERLIIVLDSLDEVVATCKQNVLKLIDKLNQEPCLHKIIIGSRLLTVNLLSNQFDIDLVEIEGLSKEWNGDYVQNWDIDGNYIRKTTPEFLKNPLYLNFLKIIATSNINMNNLNRWNLYETIIDLNIDLYYERRNQNPDETERNNILKYCYALAFQAFFPYNRLTRKLTENIKEKYTNFARIGIIRCFNKEGIPVFVHHTFLEFLISRWLLESSDKEDAKYVYEYILRNHVHDLLHIYSEQFRLHKAVIDGDLTQVQKLCNENPELLKETDGLGRTALHIAAIDSLIFRRNAEIADIILQNTLDKNFNLYPCDTLLNWTWVDHCHRYLRHKILSFHSLPDAILEAYWNYHYQIKNESSWVFMDDEVFRTCCRRAFEIPSINIIKKLFLVKHYNHKDLVEIGELCLRSEITIAELPESFMPELGTTLLHLGCIYSNVNIVSACIERGDDVNARDKLGCTPLYYGVCSQRSEIVKLLLENGADMKLHPTGQRFITLFRMSLRIQNKNIVMMLIEVIDKNLQGWDGPTPLQDASASNDIEVVEMLLKAGVNAEVLDKAGNTLLHDAVRYKYIGLIRLLSQYQVNVNMTNKLGHTPLFDALWTKDMHLIEMLLKLGADVNIPSADGTTLLRIAVNFNKDLIELFLRYGADVNSVNRRGETTLFRTVEINDTEKTKILLNAGANVDIRDINGNTPLHIAVSGRYCGRTRQVVATEETRSNMQMIEILLNANANVNVGNEAGDTPLHRAVSVGFEDAVLLLVQRQADICAKNYQQETPLFLAVAKEEIQIINILLNKGVDLNIVEDGAVPLNTVVRTRTENHQICVNMETQNGDTPLCCAIKKHHLKIVNILLENGADVNYVDKNGRHLTPLFSAIATQNLEIIEILLRKDADVNFKSEYDVTPLYVAILTGNLNVVKLLVEYKVHLNIVTSINILLTKAKQINDINGALRLLSYWANRSENLIDDVSFPNEVKHIIQTVEKEADINLMHEINLDHERNNAALAQTLLAVAADIKNSTPLAIKCLDSVLELNNEEVDRILLCNFSDKYREEVERYTDVGYAAIEGNRTMVKILLRNRQNPNISLSRVIQFSCQNHPVEILLENHIDVNSPDEHGNPPLLTAIYFGTLDVVEILLENGAAANGVNNRQPDETPLSMAVQTNSSRLMRMLLQKGANINVGKEPLLHLASERATAEIVHMLLEHGADINQKDIYGRSALHCAVERNHKDIVEKLLEFKADVNITDNNGLTPVDYVIGKEMGDIVSMLQKRGEEPDHIGDSNSTHN